MNIPVQAHSFEVRQPLSAKVSLITGSTSGIGLGIARALAAAGSHIVLNGFAAPDQVAELQKGIAADYRVRVTYSAADMSKPDAIQKMMEETLRSSGAVDILVNNAGIQHVAPLQEFPPEKWDAILAINLSADSIQRGLRFLP
jgi:3-hydroxybutyrate dehydrogenase